MENQMGEATLIDKMANAIVTYNKCAGHSKAANNMRLFKRYKKEALRRGIEVPDDNELFKRGEFNGPGSF